MSNIVLISKSQTLNLSEAFVTEKGDVIEQPVVAYEEYGLSDGPVIFLAHGGLSSHHAAGKYSEDDALSGWWDGLIGSGKAFDTDRFRIICTNTLGSMYGTSSSLSINPQTGCRYGPLFPQVSLGDTVRFQKAFLDELNIENLALMAGPSMGSLQTLEMAARYPNFVNAAITVATAGCMTPDGITMHHLMRNIILMDPGFKGGWYNANEQLLAMRTIAQLTKLYYTHERIIKKVCWDTVTDNPNSQASRAHNINAFLQATNDTDILGRDPNCYLTILDAVNSHNLGYGHESYASGVQRIHCPVLIMNIDSDREFDTSWGQELADTLNQKTPNQAQFKALTSDWGHLGCIKEVDQMTPHIKAFMELNL